MSRIGSRVSLRNIRLAAVLICSPQTIEFALLFAGGRLLESNGHMLSNRRNRREKSEGQYATIFWLRRAFTIPNRKPMFARQNENE